MNRKLLLPLAALALSLGSTACEKDPETEPVEFTRDELQWDSTDRNGTNAQLFLNNIYTYLPDGFNRVDGEFLESGTDDAVPSRLNRAVEYFTRGALTPTNNPDARWATPYAAVRRVNILLANLDRVPVTAATNTLWKAEARFARALNYFELLKRYGGVPLLGDRVLGLNENLALPRNTYAECVSYIVSECDAIKNNLRPEAGLADTDWGRITRGCAVALKGRTLLYAASPLYNGGRLGGATDLQGYPNYDQSRWQLALDANLELNTLTSNYYSLVTTGVPTAYTSVFTTKRNREIILGNQSSNNTSLENALGPIGYATFAVSSQGLTSPTQNFVNAFPTLTGLPIGATGSGYDPQNPYANRDPRLAASVFTNGTPWLGRPVETFDGGRDRPGGAATQTRTGYYLRKFLGNFATNTVYANTSHNYPIFRYAETLLNIAEAYNELGQPEQAVTRLVLLRSRAGLTAGANGRYGIPVGISQGQLRELIRTERRIELSFEEHRFWDVRRWKTAETELNGPLFGVRIANATPLVFTYPQLSTMVFPARLYYLPLPNDEILENPSLVQNPGW